MLPDVTEHTRATSFADSIVRPLVKSLPLVCAGLNSLVLQILSRNFWLSGYEVVDFNAGSIHL